MKESVLLWVLVVPLMYLVITIYESRINSRFIFVHKGILLIIQGCSRASEQDLYIRIIN